MTNPFQKELETLVECLVDLAAVTDLEFADLIHEYTIDVLKQIPIKDLLEGVQHRVINSLDYVLITREMCSGCTEVLSKLPENFPNLDYQKYREFLDGCLSDLSDGQSILFPLLFCAGKLIGDGSNTGDILDKVKDVDVKPVIFDKNIDSLIVKKDTSFVSIVWTGKNLKEVIDILGRHSSLADMPWSEYEALVREKGFKIISRSFSFIVPIGSTIQKTGGKVKVIPEKTGVTAVLTEEEITVLGKLDAFWVDHLAQLPALDVDEVDVKEYFRDVDNIRNRILARPGRRCLLDKK